MAEGIFARGGIPSWGRFRRESLDTILHHVKLSAKRHQSGGRAEAESRNWCRAHSRNRRNLWGEGRRQAGLLQAEHR